MKWLILIITLSLSMTLRVHATRQDSIAEVAPEPQIEQLPIQKEKAATKPLKQPEFKTAAVERKSKPRPAQQPAIPATVFCVTQQSMKRPNLANARIGQEMAARRGWTGYEWTALYELWACESSWTHTVWNTAGSGAYGIPQSLPASKMATKGRDYLTNPRTQISWGLEYIKGRYGSPSAALSFHRANNWY